MLLIDYYQIKKNIKELKKSNEIIPVLKNDAYGFGLEEILRICLEFGINSFGVNDFEEAIRIRKISSSCEIILFGSYNNIYNYIKYNVYPTATSLNAIKELEELEIPYYIKINTNMNRFGISDINAIVGKRYLKGIYAHIPKLDDEMIDKINRLGLIATLYNLKFSCGGGLLVGNVDYPVRVGGRLYKDSRRMYGHILEIKRIKKGQPIGYESYYYAPKDHLYAIVDIGYYNGLNRYFDGAVCIGDTLYKVIGLVCMNHTFILVDERVSLGDLVEFFGINIPIEDFLVHNRMTLYESFICLR